MISDFHIGGMNFPQMENFNEAIEIVEKLTKISKWIAINSIRANLSLHGGVFFFFVSDEMEIAQIAIVSCSALMIIKLEQCTQNLHVNIHFHY